MEKTKPRGNPMRHACAWGCGGALLLALRGRQRDSAEPRLRKDLAAMRWPQWPRISRAKQGWIVLRCTTCCAQ
ncbi:hypothetical protein [Xanthomonas graminis]|uniref:hypothetical protein n=1 Tax=Xanthomonas graminis TaxID=3390026 RepID=UPI0021B0FE02|nr:hypothetical protein [Xanthomonas translucens]